MSHVESGGSGRRTPIGARGALPSLRRPATSSLRGIRSLPFATTTHSKRGGARARRKRGDAEGGGNSYARRAVGAVLSRFRPPLGGDKATTGAAGVQSLAPVLQDGSGRSAARAVAEAQPAHRTLGHTRRTWLAARSGGDRRASCAATPFPKLTWLTALAARGSACCSRRLARHIPPSFFFSFLVESLSVLHRFGTRPMFTNGHGAGESRRRFVRRRWLRLLIAHAHPVV